MPPILPRDSDLGRGPTLTMLDLFAGAGGLSEGFHQAGGFEVVGAVEQDPRAAATFAANHGDVVHALGIHDWLETHDVPDVDVVVGGPPCQSFSTLGRKDPGDGRATLWNEYVEVVLRARPLYFVLENVGAFTRAPQYGALAAEVSPNGRLHDYDFVVGVLNAADYGTPQVRKRTVFLGYHRDLPRPPLPLATHAGAPQTVRQAFRERDVQAHVKCHPLPDRRTQSGQPGPFTSAELHLDRTYSSLSKARIRCIPPGGNRHDLPESLQAPCWRGFHNGAYDVMGRLYWDRPSVTIRTEFVKPEKGRYLHPEEHRAITLYEGAVLQGFPDGYRWIGSRTDIARQIGNAVPIQLGRAIAQQIRAESSKTLRDPQVGRVNTTGHNPRLPRHPGVKANRLPPVAADSASCRLRDFTS